jgi:hypothetical protein
LEREAEEFEKGDLALPVRFGASSVTHKQRKQKQKQAPRSPTTKETESEKNNNRTTEEAQAQGEGGEEEEEEKFTFSFVSAVTEKEYNQIVTKRSAAACSLLLPFTFPSPPAFFFSS